MMNPKLTIFTAPKPFKDTHISNIQYNAIRSWKKLEPDVSIVLIGDEEGVESVAKELDVYFVPDVKRNSQRTPLISSIFEIGRNINTESTSGIYQCGHHYISGIFGGFTNYFSEI